MPYLYLRFISFPDGLAPTVRFSEPLQQLEHRRTDSSTDGPSQQMVTSVLESVFDDGQDTPAHGSKAHTPSGSMTVTSSTGPTMLLPHAALDTAMTGSATDLGGWARSREASALAHLALKRSSLDEAAMLATAKSFYSLPSSPLGVPDDKVFRSPPVTSRSNAQTVQNRAYSYLCLLYTSDAADE